MGKAIEQIAIANGHEVTDKIEATDSLTNLSPSTAQVAIEFTQPESAFNNIKFCLEKGIPVISGTTGWLDQMNKILDICNANNGTFLYASNFSIGVNLFFELNEWLANKIAKLNFNPMIKEIHHTEKKDSPSGTAITLAEAVLSNDPSRSDWINEKSTDHTKLPIVSERKPNVAGTHTVTYTSPLETIELTHVAHDRSVFAEGVVKVAEWIHTKKGVFTMSDFINDN